MSNTQLAEAAKILGVSEEAFPLWTMRSKTA